MVGDLADVLQVGGDAGDHVPRLGVVEEAEGELLQVLKDVAPHVGLDVDAEHVAPVGHDILQRGVEHVDAQQCARGEQDQPPILAGQQPVDKLVDGEREAQFEQPHNEGAAEVEKEEVAVGSIVGCELAEHGGRFQSERGVGRIGAGAGAGEMDCLFSIHGVVGWRQLWKQVEADRPSAKILA